MEMMKEPKSQYRFVVKFINNKISTEQQNSLSVNINKIDVEFGIINRLIIDIRDEISNTVFNSVNTMLKEEHIFDIQLFELDGTNNETDGYHSIIDYTKCQIAKIKTTYDYSSPEAKVLQMYINFEDVDFKTK